MTDGPEPDNYLFTEVQRFRQPWIWFLIGSVAAISWFAFISQVILMEPFGNNPASDSVLLVILLIFGIGFPLWFLVMRLEIRVNGSMVSFRFFPFHIRWRNIPAKEIISAESVVYRPILEYGGWGIRYGRGGWAYNISGNQGVVVRLASGRAFLLGSRRAEELERAVRALVSHP